MHDEVNEIASHYGPAFKQLVSWLYHGEPLAYCSEHIAACADTLTIQLEAVENAQYCVQLLRDTDTYYDTVHDWSLS